MDDQKRREQRAASAVQRANRSNSNTMATVAMVCGALSVYVWTNPPEFIQPAPFEQQAFSVTNAAMKSAVAINAQRIADFQSRTGRLPNTKEEFDAAYPEATVYTPLSGGLYELRIVEGEDTITYRSDQDLQALVGNAGSILEGGAP